MAQVFMDAMRDGKDLIYEGIATPCLDVLFRKSKIDGKDLIYEGIATSRHWSFIFSASSMTEKT